MRRPPPGALRTVTVLLRMRDTRSPSRPTDSANDAVRGGTALAEVRCVARNRVTTARVLGLLLVASPIAASAEGQRPIVGVQVLGAAGTHVGEFDVGRHHELRTFVRLGLLQPVV